MRYGLGLVGSLRGRWRSVGLPRWIKCLVVSSLHACRATPGVEEPPPPRSREARGMRARRGRAPAPRADPALRRRRHDRRKRRAARSHGTAHAGLPGGPARRPSRPRGATRDPAPRSRPAPPPRAHAPRRALGPGQHPEIRGSRGHGSRRLASPALRAAATRRPHRAPRERLPLHPRRWTGALAVRRAAGSGRQVASRARPSR